MWFGLLGALAVRDDAGADRAVPAAKQRVLLAALLLRANETVARDDLVQALWDGEPPRNAGTALRVYVTRLRRTLGDTGCRIEGVPSGYRVNLAEPAELDLWRVETLRKAGQAAFREGRADRAAGLFREAEELWRGTPLVDVASDALRMAHLAHLAELRLRITEARVDADLRCGRAEEVVGELRALAGAHPLREHLHGRLMTALALSGRQAEASAVFQEVRRTLVDELGAEPGARLCRVQRAVLAGRAAELLALEGAAGTPEAERAAPNRPEGAAARAGSGAGAGPAPRRVVRFELPPSVADFTGRDEEVRLLCAALTGPAGPASGLALVTGPGGVGKSALATRVGHQVRDRFPDGQLWVDLGGGARAVPPDEALGRVLLDLGADGKALPAGTEARSALLRSLLAGRRVLLVLDNARDSAQIRPLLPGTTGCAAVVTSRSQLPDLEGASRFDLAVLPADAARRLFARIAGEARVAAEPAATGEVLEVCAGLPLAVRIAAARLAARGAWRVRHLADLLRDRSRHLDELRAGDLGVRSCFETGYVDLPPPTARAFRLLGALPQPRVTLPVVAALLDVPVRQAEETAEQLVSANLLECHAPGHYRCHDLLRSYAAELVRDPDRDPERRAAVHRVVAWYTHTAFAADEVLNPGGVQNPVLSPPPAGVTPLAFDDDAGALAWCEAERDGFLLVGRAAAEDGLHDLAWQLPFGLWHFYYRRSYVDDLAAGHAVGLASAVAAGDLPGQARMHNGLALAAAERGRTDAALDHLARARECYRRVGDTPGESITLGNLGYLHNAAGRAEEAVRCYRAALVIEGASDGHQLNRAISLNNLGESYAHLGRHAEALGTLRESLGLTRKLGNQHHEVFVLDTIGAVHLTTGALDEAARHFRQSLDLCRKLANPANEAQALGRLGDVCARSGDPAGALAYWRRAVTIYQEIGNPAADRIRDRVTELVGALDD